ncbi:hypothetical protein NliqN6_5192 [Naganishia liquefaciens]|uniref:CFEM domain-containing protein n=1 Tax=Naganishia liquefaciens TaxID=104408 RepID=A0A8H3TX17_9TREE|nr:hypothetical protein NliqN6_5192 [Naganishia liquefaciens]
MKLVGLAITLSLAAPLAAAASLQIRQQWDDLPDCFRICFGQAVTNNKGCALDDIACFCAQQQLIDALTSCVSDTCKGDEIRTSIGFGTAYCASGGVQITPSVSMIADSSNPVEPSGVEVTATVSVEDSATTTDDFAPTSVIESVTVSLTGVGANASTPSSAASTAATSAAASATQSGAAMGLVMPRTGLLAGLLAVVLAM